MDIIFYGRSSYVLSMYLLCSMKVSVKLYGIRGIKGQEMESEVLDLHDPDTERFKAGHEDNFIVTTPMSLGRLTHIEIWHDCFGPHPDWSVIYTTTIILLY